MGFKKLLYNHLELIALFLFWYVFECSKLYFTLVYVINQFTIDSSIHTAVAVQIAIIHLSPSKKVDWKFDFFESDGASTHSLNSGLFSRNQLKFEPNMVSFVYSYISSVIINQWGYHVLMSTWLTLLPPTWGRWCCNLKLTHDLFFIQIDRRTKESKYVQ